MDAGEDVLEKDLWSPYEWVVDAAEDVGEYFVEEHFKPIGRWFERSVDDVVDFAEHTYEDVSDWFEEDAGELLEDAKEITIDMLEDIGRTIGDWRV